MKIEQIISNSEADTYNAGKEFAERLDYGSLAIFTGELGAGKTQFIKGIGEYFNIAEDITSPSFAIINQYSGSLDGDSIPILHIDLYRLTKKSELATIGFNELIYDEDSIKLIEWPEIAEQYLSEAMFKIEIQTHPAEVSTRKIIITEIKN